MVRDSTERNEILESSEESIRLLDSMIRMSIDDAEVHGQQVGIRDDQVL